MKAQNKVYDRISYNNILVDNELALNRQTESIRSNVTLKDNADEFMVLFKTWRPLITEDPLDYKLYLDSYVPLTIASGSTVETLWEERVEHGTVDLFFRSVPLEY